MSATAGSCSEMRIPSPAKDSLPDERTALSPARMSPACSGARAGAHVSGARQERTPASRAVVRADGSAAVASAWPQPAAVQDASSALT